MAETIQQALQLATTNAQLSNDPREDKTWEQNGCKS
jgi:hypothetical protein